MKDLTENSYVKRDLQFNSLRRWQQIKTDASAQYEENFQGPILSILSSCHIACAEAEQDYSQGITHRACIDHRGSLHWREGFC